LLEWNGKKLNQSFTIARYLAKQYNLVGADDFEAAKCDEYADVVKDVLKGEFYFFAINQTFVRNELWSTSIHSFFFLSPEVESMWHEDEAKKLKIKNNVLDKTLPALFTKVEADLKATDGGKFLVGNNYTWSDFVLAHFTEVFESFVDPSFLANYPSIKAHQKNVQNIPQIKSWIAKRPVTEY
jgi:glutathione S-transferase